MNRKEITEILEEHEKWLLGKEGGLRANLCRANLMGADLQGANLYGADIRWANLREANLFGANLYEADLRWTSLHAADLCGADLRFACFYGADLHGAHLCAADLCGADLRFADLQGADLHGAINVPFIPMACPDEGSFIAWKKAYTRDAEYLVKLRIPEDAKRSSATGRKCRCDKAEVLEITNIKSGEKVSEVTNNHYVNTRYEVGAMVFPDSFDENRLNECSNGIHFFTNKQEALDYMSPRQIQTR